MDEIKSLMSWDGTGKIYSEETVRALQAEIERLREAHRWIPVSERLPDEDVTVLITGGKAVETGCYAEEKWWQMGNAVIVTHWMPLPQPPQEAEGN